MPVNGKVERAQRTALEKFWPTVDLKDASLPDQLDEWQTFYNWNRSHGALCGRTPIDRICELITKGPLIEDVWNAYDLTKERIRTQDYPWDNDLCAHATMTADPATFS